MINIDKDSYGGTIRVNFGQSLTSATTLKMIFTPQSGSDVNVTPTLGTSRIAVGNEYYDANEYLEYTITENMFDDYVGLWNKRATALIGTELVVSPSELFRVTGLQEYRKNRFVS
jgi:hypothetical protein